MRYHIDSERAEHKDRNMAYSSALNYESDWDGKFGWMEEFLIIILV